MKRVITIERARAGLSQRELAIKLDVDVNTVSRWERNPGMIRWRDIIKLSLIFDCSTDYLLGLTEARHKVEAR